MTTDEYISDWNRRRCKGYMKTWVARPNQPLNTVAANLQTICRNNAISAAELAAMIAEVREDSVSSFFAPPYNCGPERQVRLEELVTELGKRGLA